MNNAADNTILMEVATGNVRCALKPNVYLGTLLASGFADSNSFFVVEAAGSKSILSFYDFQCHLVAHHDVNTRVANAASTDGLIALFHQPSISILKGPRWQEWKTVVEPRPWASTVFAQNGTVICTGAMAGAMMGGDGSIQCWSLQEKSGRPFRTFTVRKGATGHITGASKATRVAFLQSSYSQNPFIETETVVAKRYVVWDFESGRTIADLPPRQQSSYARYEGPNKGSEPFALALSPNGIMLSLAGDDVVEVYYLPM